MTQNTDGAKQVAQEQAVPCKHFILLAVQVHESTLQKPERNAFRRQGRKAECRQGQPKDVTKDTETPHAGRSGAGLNRKKLQLQATQQLTRIGTQLNTEYSQ